MKPALKREREEVHTEVQKNSQLESAILGYCLRGRLTIVCFQLQSGDIYLVNLLK